MEVVVIVEATEQASVDEHTVENHGPLARVTRYVEPAGGVSVARRSQWHDSLTCAGGQDTRERESRAQNDHSLSPRPRNGTHKRHIPVD